MKKCPNCGACQECGHAPNLSPWRYGPMWVAPMPYDHSRWWNTAPTTSAHPGVTWTTTNGTAQ